MRYGAKLASKYLTIALPHPLFIEIIPMTRLIWYRRKRFLQLKCNDTFASFFPFSFKKYLLVHEVPRSIYTFIFIWMSCLELWIENSGVEYHDYHQPARPSQISRNFLFHQIFSQTPPLPESQSKSLNIVTRLQYTRGSPVSPGLPRDTFLIKAGNSTAY